MKGHKNAQTTTALAKLIFSNIIRQQYLLGIYVLNDYNQL